MKHAKIFVLSIAVVLLAGVLAAPAQAQVSFDLAYSNLSRHGTWVVSAQYGHVWQPREYNQDWNPYYDGHWVYTEMGWTWVSDYEWGSIPYHYGTWVAEPGIGWVWIPGYVWAPSWVVFRTGPEYIGWAPVPPGYSVGMSIDFGVSSSFVFVSSREFLAPRIRTSIIPVSRTNVFINNTTIVNNIVIQNNIVINNGPDIRIVEKATGKAIRRQRIESVARVAPFDHVSRAQLAVDPERRKHGVRVAEPVPSSQPLPGSDKDRKGKQNGKAPRADASSPSYSPDTSDTREKTSKPEAVTPRTGSATTQQPRSSASTEPNAKARPEPGTRAQSNAKARADRAVNAQASAKVRADAAVKAKADRTARAQASAKAKAQKAKAEAEAKAKKQDPGTGAKNSEPTDPKSKSDTPQ